MQRIDKGMFELDEILLGALLVTGLMFLYPTIAMYYLCFVSIWLSVQALQLVIMCLLTVMNHFPFYMIAEYFYGHGFLIKSVYFDVSKDQGSENFPTNYLFLRTQKHGFLSLFDGLLKKIKLQLYELFNFGVLKHIISGSRIPRTVNKDFVV